MTATATTPTPFLDRAAEAAPIAKEATEKAVGSLLTASPASLASFPVLSATVATAWGACKQLPAGFLNSAWVPLTIAMLISVSSFLLNLPKRGEEAYRLKLFAAIALIPINGVLIAAAALAGTEATGAASDKLT
jgi:hypothetical protein